MNLSYVIVFAEIIFDTLICLEFNFLDRECSGADYRIELIYFFLLDKWNFTLSCYVAVELNSKFWSIVIILFFFFVQFKPDEIKNIMKDFDEPGTLAPIGLHLGGNKYMVIQGEPGAVIRGKKVTCLTKTIFNLLQLQGTKFWIRFMVTFLTKPAGWWIITFELILMKISRASQVS